MMTKSDTIAEIMTLNPTVGAPFLADFSNQDLINYLRRLRSLTSPDSALTPAATRRNESVRSSSLSSVAAVPA